jgi:hypothetical protein
MLRGNIQKMPYICGDTVSDRLKGSLCFLLAGDMMGNAPIEFQLLFKHFQKCICYSGSVAEWVPNTLWAFFIVAITL